MPGHNHSILIVALIVCGACQEPSTASDVGLPIDNPLADAAVSDVGFLDAGRSDVGAASGDGPPCQSECEGQCFAERCVPDRQRLCEVASDCPEGEQCSVLGECYDTECLGHQDCSPAQRCALGRCLTRVAPDEGVFFERVYVDAFSDHISPMNVDDYTAAYGFGMALIDIDGDLDLDVFVGTQRTGRYGSPACIYRNDSIPGNLRFEPIEEFCQVRSEVAISGFGLDVEGDGFHELLITGKRLAELHRFHPRHEVIDLLATLSENSPGRDCYANAALPVDLNFDGLLDIVLGCGAAEVSFDQAEPNHILGNVPLLQTEEGLFRPLMWWEWDPQDSLLLSAQALTHGLGAADVNGDGLMDLLVSEEAFYSSRTNSYQGDSGGVYQRCAPGRECRFEALRLGYDTQQYGSYMGSGMLQIEGRGEHLYFSNLEANRMVRHESGVIYDIAVETGTDLARFDGQPVFSWGVVVDDFDRDGRDDLFVSNGSLFFQSPQMMSGYDDTLLLQREEASFSMYSAEVGIAPLSHSDSHHDSRVYSSRATIKSDLDGDGFLDLITVGLEGVPKIHREVPNQRADSPRCSLVPVDRYVPGFGIGHAIIPEGDPRPRQWDAQGQHRTGASPFVVTPWTRGKLRFPSGVEVAYDCQDKAGPVVVHEPQWLLPTVEGRRLTLAPHDAMPSGELSLYCEPSRELIQGVVRSGEWVVDIPEGTERYMVRFGERWVGRWWSL